MNNNKNVNPYILKINIDNEIEINSEYLIINNDKPKEFVEKALNNARDVLLEYEEGATYEEVIEYSSFMICSKSDYDLMAECFNGYNATSIQNFLEKKYKLKTERIIEDFEIDLD